MADIINLEAIPVSKRPTAKINFLAVWPNTEVDENDDPLYTDVEWLQMKWWEMAKRINRKGHTIRQTAAAGEPDDIQTE